MESLSQYEQNKRDYFSEPMSQVGSVIKASLSLPEKYKKLMEYSLISNKIDAVVFFGDLDHLPFKQTFKVS